ncbi:MAG: hypothetical protein FWG58_01015, partial [Methanomassiliicoccaceae archaeon]|nr:hypothetical protein [Methanomassiliicoccaceae archaeon]
MLRMITLAIVVMAVLPASVILFNDTAAAAGTEIAGLKGSGAETDPYLISSVNDLRTVSSSHSNHPGAYYKQTADIVFVNTITGSSVTITITKENNNIVIGIGTNAAVPANEDGTTTFAHVALNSSQSSSDWENGFKNVIFDVS